MQSDHHFNCSKENNEMHNPSNYLNPNFSIRESERNFIPPFQPPMGDGSGLPPFQPPMGDGSGLPPFQPPMGGGSGLPPFQPPMGGGSGLPPFQPPMGGGSGLPPFQPPMGGGPGPVLPPKPTGFGNIRFLYVATNQPPVNVFIDETMVVRSLRYGNITPYYSAPSGTKRITITSSQSPNKILASINLFLSNEETYTIAILNSTNGLELYIISDMPCRMRRGMSCLRAVNLIANSGAVNIFTPNIGLLFRQVNFKDITAYQQLNPGNYTIYATDYKTTTFPVGNQIQIAIINGIFRPLIISNISLEHDTTYTLYLIGNISGFPAAQILLAETDLDY